MLHTINTLAQLKPILIGFRKSNNLTQQDMADRLGVTQQTYQKLESSPQNVTVDRLFKVLALLGVKLHLSDSKKSTDNKASLFSKTKFGKINKFAAGADINSKSMVAEPTGNNTAAIMKDKSRKEQW